MKVRTTIILLLLLVSALSAAGLLAMRRIERKKLAHLTETREASWRLAVEQFLDRDDAPLRKMVEHFATLDGIVPAILDSDAAWAGQHLDDAALRSFGANAFWLFAADGTLRYAHQNIDPDGQLAPPLAGAELAQLFAKARAQNFHAELPRSADTPGPRRFLQVAGYRIHPPWDYDGKSPVEGVLLIGRVQDAQTLSDLPLLSNEDQVGLRAQDEPPLLEESAPDTIRVLREWKDARGAPLATLVVSNHSPVIAALDRRADELLLTLVAGSLAVTALVYLLLSWSILRPLELIRRGLNHKDLPSIAPLMRRRSEFGELARLIQRFYGQQTDLVREMRERVATQESLRRSEEMLQHSQKMEAVGRLAGGVAHDFNNLLTAIIGYAGLLMQRFQHDPAAHQDAHLILQAGERAAGLTRQLLVFSRKQLLQPKVIDLSQLVHNLHKMLQRIIGEHIVMRVEVLPDGARVRADAGQIEQVVVNLGVNARDAMPRGGQLTIRTRLLALDADNPSQLPAGEYVALEVVDTGTGMDEATQRQIFEPFFTTKGPGKGTGLGLATVYGIVKQSRGGIVVESVLGQGTTFRILLPAEAAPVDVAEAAPVAAQAARAGECILLVEDEEIVRELVCEVLRGTGYKILAADSGPAALKLLHEGNSQVDLLISDVVMPDMNGAEVARRVREISPRVRVLFVSGYSENDMTDQGLDALDFEILQKPFTPDTLTNKVREVLDAGGGSK